MNWRSLLVLLLCANSTHSCLLMCIIPLPCYLGLMYKERHSRAEEMHSQAEASSFPREGWGGGQRCSLVCRTRTLSVFHRRERKRERLPLAWAAFINTLAICCGQRFSTYYNNNTHRRCPETEREKWGGGVKNIVTDYRQYVDDFIAILSYALPRFLVLNLHSFPFSFCATFTDVPLLSLPRLASYSEAKGHYYNPPSSQVLHNQIFDLMKGFNYWLHSTGGVRLLLPLFIFLCNLSLSWQRRGVYACTKIFFEAACWRSERGPVYKFVVSWPLETVGAEMARWKWHLNYANARTFFPAQGKP